MNGALISPETAARLRLMMGDTERPRTAAISAGGSGVAWVMVKCDSATAAGGSGAAAQCYSATIREGTGDGTTGVSRGNVWLTLLDGDWAAKAPEAGRLYACVLSGSLDIGGDVRPRAYATYQATPSIPDATPSVRGLVNTGMQNFGGMKIFQDAVNVVGRLGLSDGANIGGEYGLSIGFGTAWRFRPDPDNPTTGFTIGYGTHSGLNPGFIQASAGYLVLERGAVKVTIGDDGTNVFKVGDFVAFQGGGCQSADFIAVGWHGGSPVSLLSLKSDIDALPAPFEGDQGTW